MGTLDSKVIVIIGGTTGLGFSAARAFIARGARVVVVGRNPNSCATAQSQLGDSARALPGDAMDPLVAPRAIQLAVETFGKFTGLYHVAGGSGRKFGDGPLHEISDHGWTATLDLNLTSLFYSNRAATLQFLQQGGGGTVLNMGSVLGFSPSPKYFSTHAYAAAKAAIIGLTKASASFYAPHNIRFNVVAPALVETPMAQRAVNNPTISHFIPTKQPLDGGRVGAAEDLDGAAVLFMSDQSRFITGQVLAVDGGWTHSDGQIASP
ncbi:MAG: SDR family oxidoreductase [Verrucomicrobiota bacterium]|nr:SDR family oxidoreductase [Verrucomicrobiota bacterium]